MKLLKIIPDKGKYLHRSTLIYEHATEKGEDGTLRRQKYEVFSRRPIEKEEDLNGFVAGVMAIVENGYGEILISKEFRLGVNKDVYGIPGGMVGKDETAEEAIKRELREECGIDEVEVLRVSRPRFTNPAMMPEMTQIAYCRTAGSPDLSVVRGSSEEIFNTWVSKEALKQMIEDEDFSAIPAFALLHYVETM